MTWIFKPCTRDLFGSYYLCIKLTYVYICIKCTFTKFWGRCQNEDRTFYRCIINHICSVCRTFNRSTFSGDAFIISTYITNHQGRTKREKRSPYVTLQLFPLLKAEIRQESSSGRRSTLKEQWSLLCFHASFYTQHSGIE